MRPANDSSTGLPRPTPFTRDPAHRPAARRRPARARATTLCFSAQGRRRHDDMAVNCGVEIPGEQAVDGDRLSETGLGEVALFLGVRHRSASWMRSTMHRLDFANPAELLSSTSGAGILAGRTIPSSRRGDGGPIEEMLGCWHGIRDSSSTPAAR